jgi:GAF domain-containing protein
MTITVPVPAYAFPILATLNAIVHDEEPLRVMLTKVSELGRTHIPGVDAASIAVLWNGQPLETGFTGSLASALNERQYRPEYGPGIQAARTGAVIQIDDTATDSRCPGFLYEARRQGLRRVLAIGMPERQSVAVAVSVYSAEPENAWDQSTYDGALSFASYVRTVVLNAVLYRAAVEESRHMRRAMDSRAGIEQAKGMIMLNYGCTEEEAFERLAATSVRTHRKVRDVAQELVEGRNDP